MRQAYPGTWGARYDELQAAAIKAGVCAKILPSWGDKISDMHACGQPVTHGAYCERHQR